MTLAKAMRVYNRLTRMHVRAYFRKQWHIRLIVGKELDMLVEQYPQLTGLD